MGKKEISFEGTMKMKEALGHLEELLSSLKSGTVNFKKGEETISLTPEKEVNFEIVGAQKKDKEKISFEISWHFPEQPEEIPEFKISPKGKEEKVESAEDKKETKNTKK